MKQRACRVATFAIGITLFLLSLPATTRAQTVSDPGFPIIAMRQLKTNASIDGFPKHIPELPRPFASEPTEMVKIQNGQVTVLDCKLPTNPTENYEICDHAKLSFDGRWVYYTKFTKPTAGEQTNSSDIYKINLETLEKVRLTFQEFTPNTGVVDWGNDPKNSAQTPGKYSVNHGVFNMHPVPVPFKDGKPMVAFVSSRDMFGRSRRSNQDPATRLYIGHDYGAEGLKNVRNIDYMFLDLVGRLNILSTGKLVASYLHTQGLHHLEGRTSGVWEIDPDGRSWSPRVSGLDGSVIWRGETETAQREIVSVGYYQSKNAGLGQLIGCPTTPPLGQPQFGFSFPLDPRNSMRYSFPCTGGRIVTPFSHVDDSAARKDSNGNFMGKVTNAAAAPGNRLLAVWSGNSPANNDLRPIRGLDAMRIVIFGDKATITDPGQMQVIVYDPAYHYMQPVAAVSYKTIYGIDQPAELPWLPNDGSVHKELPAGTPYGLIGTSSFLHNFNDPVLPQYNEGVSPRGHNSGLPTSISGGRKLYLEDVNWGIRGAENGYYTKDDIYAVRIIGMNAFTEASAATRNFAVSHETEQLSILGEIPLRKFTATGAPVLDDDGNPDTSFLAKIPADMAFTFQTLDRNGMVLNMAQTWHQVRPGEGRWDCGGCHGHSTAGSDFSKKAAAKPDYSVLDLTKGSYLLVKDLASGKLVPQKQSTQAFIPEFNRDIKPILQAKCVQCHTTQNGKTPPGLQPGGLDLSDFSTARNGHPVAYNRLMYGNADGALPAGYFTRWVDDYLDIARYGSRSSYLMWKLFGARMDGYTNADLPTPRVLTDRSTFPAGLSTDWWRMHDRDYSGAMCPPAGSGIPALSDEEKLKFARWIDLGLAISSESAGKLGYTRDETKPVIALYSPKKEKNFGALKNIRVGLNDYCPSCSGESLDMSTFSVKADFQVNGRSAGSELASFFSPADDHVWSMALSPAITALERGTLTVRIKDKSGNLKVIENLFSVTSGSGPAAPTGLRIATLNDATRTATLTWDAPTTLANGSPLPAGSVVTYRMLVGSSTGQYSRSFDVGTANRFSMSGIETAYFLVKAKIAALSAEESDSNEISVRYALTPTPSPTPGRTPSATATATPAGTQSPLRTPAPRPSATITPLVPPPGDDPNSCRNKPGGCRQKGVYRDFDGDKETDLMLVRRNHKQFDLSILLSKSGRVFKYSGTDQWSSADFDGDGTFDIAEISSRGGLQQWKMRSPSKKKTWRKSFFSAEGTAMPTTCDLDGDGIADPTTVRGRQISVLSSVSKRRYSFRSNLIPRARAIECGDPLGAGFDSILVLGRGTHEATSAIYALHPSFNDFLLTEVPGKQVRISVLDFDEDKYDDLVVVDKNRLATTVPMGPDAQIQSQEFPLPKFTYYEVGRFRASGDAEPKPYILTKSGKKTKLMNMLSGVLSEPVDE